VRDLRKVKGKTIRSVHSGTKKLRVAWRTSWNARITGCQIEAVRRRGKWIILDLTNNQKLLIHLGMSWRFTNISQETTADRHVVFQLDDGTELQFFDPRRFGSITLHENEEVIQSIFKKKRLGPEPFDLRVPFFSVAVINTTRNLKAILLDQTIVAGIGN